MEDPADPALLPRRHARLSAPRPELPPDFVALEVRPGLDVYVGRLPRELEPSADAFEELWALRPPASPNAIVNRLTRAYGRDYAYSGKVENAAPTPEQFRPYADWMRAAVDARIDGLLVNWYDAAIAARIAAHKDAKNGRVPGAPIVIASLGAARTFLLFAKKRVVPLRVLSGTVVVLPDAVNDRVAHAVRHQEDDVGRRISITGRAFVPTT